MAVKVPFLLGLDMLNQDGIVLQFGCGFTGTENVACLTKFTYVGNHAFVSFNNTHDIHWSKADITKLHLHFCHPTSGMLFHLLRHLRPEATPSSVLDALKLIGDAYASCQGMYAPPFPFHVSILEASIRINAALAMDLV